MKHINELLTEFGLVRLLYVLYQTPARKQSTASRGRASFLEEARDLRNATPEPVSHPSLYSLKRWSEKLNLTFQTIKENKMLMKFSAMVLVVALVFGGAATAVQAAEASLPGQAMYQLKIIVEDVQGTVAGPVVRVQQSMLRVETRIQEILRLNEQGDVVQETAFTRLQNQLDQTLRLVLRLNGEEFSQELAQVRTRLMAQAQLLAQLQDRQPGEDAVLARLRSMLQGRLQLLGDENADPAQVKLQLQERERTRDQESKPEGGVNPPAGEGGPGPGPGNEEAPKGTCTPVQDGTGPGPGPMNEQEAPKGTGTPIQDGTGPGPGPEAGPGPGATPTPGDDSGSGPGPGAGGPTGTCTPVQDGTGPGPGPGATPTPGDGAGFGPGATPTPGGGAGPGPGATPTCTCTPVQDGTGPGPGPGAGATPTPGGAGSGGKP